VRVKCVLSGFSPWFAQERGQGIRCSDVIVPVRKGKREVILRLRTAIEPDAVVALVLAQLGLHLPKGSKIAQNGLDKSGCFFS